MTDFKETIREEFKIPIFHNADELYLNYQAASLEIFQDFEISEYEL